MNRGWLLLGRRAACLLSIALLVHCSSASSSDTPDPGNDADAGPGAKDAGKKDGGKTTNKDSGTAPGDDDDAGGDDDATAPPGDDDDSGSTADCGDWKVGTLTGYNNSDSADDPNSGSVMEFTGLTAAFYNNVPIASIDMSDWPHDQYKYVDIKYKGVIGRVEVWDACLNSDCPDGTSCCSDNKKLFSSPGYLLDVETRTAKRLWGVDKAEDVLQDKIEYRICGSFDPDKIADQYGATRSQ
jgi:hypothetical protein